MIDIDSLSQQYFVADFMSNILTFAATYDFLFFVSSLMIRNRFMSNEQVLVTRIFAPVAFLRTCFIIVELLLNSL